MSFQAMREQHTDRHTDRQTDIHTHRQTELKYYIRFVFNKSKKGKCAFGDDLVTKQST